MKGRRVLITGGFGFIGSNLVHHFAEQGAIVTVLDNLDPNAGGNRNNLGGIESKVKIIDGDIRDAACCVSAVAGQQLIIHCAALTSHKASQENPIEYEKTNALGTLNLLEAVRHTNSGARFISIGTSTQTGPMLRAPIDESHPEFPVDVYSATKAASEKYVLVYAKSHGMRTSVVRLSNVYGPRANIQTAKFGFMNYFVGLALQGKEISIFGDGAQLRTPFFVDDCVEAICAVCESENAVGEVYFATGDRHESVAAIAEMIVKQIGGTVRLVPWPSGNKAIDVGDAVISNEKIKTSVNWVPRTGLAEGLRRMREFYLPRLQLYL